MKNNRIILPIIILALGLILSACGGRGFVANSWPGLSIHNERIYVAFDQYIYSINPDTGAESIRYPIEGDNGVTFFAPPAFAEDSQILLSGYNNILYSFNLSSRTENWTFENNNRFIASPLVSGERIFAPNADHILYALSTSGRELWTFETGEALWSTPVSDGERVYISSQDQFIYALNPETGAEIWSQDLGGTSVSSPILSENGTLYIGTFESEVIALNSTNGRIIWRASTSNWVWSSPTLVDDRLYITDLSGTLYALSAETGNQLWEVTGDGPAPGSPLVHEDSVYFSTEAGTLYAVNTSGSIRWSRTVGEDAKLYSSPVQINDLIIVGVLDADPIVVAFTTNGEQQWQFQPEN